MATWKDGAAYAPIERPDGFATPEVDPLEAATPQVADTPGPMPPPYDMAATGPAVPLEAIDPSPASARNPSEPFQVTSALLTADDSPTGERDPRTPFRSLGPTSPDALPPPTGAPLTAPPAGMPLAAPPPGLPQQAPPGVDMPAQPGMPVPQQGIHPPQGYTLQPPAQQEDQQQKQRRQLQYLATGLMGVGVLVWSASAILLILAGAILTRVPHQKRTATTALTVGILLLLVWLVDRNAVGAYGALASIIGLTMVLSNWRPPAQKQR